MSCWNVGTTCSWSLGKKVPGPERPVAGQVKRLVLSGVIPTIQQQRELLFRAFHTLSIKKSDNECKKVESYFMSCWNVGTTCSWSLGKKVPWSERPVAGQVKRLVLSGVIPTIQQQRFHTLSIKKSDNVCKKVEVESYHHFMSCWNVGTTCSWSLGKKVPWSERPVAGQVKRLVLSGCHSNNPTTEPFLLSAKLEI